MTLLHHALLVVALLALGAAALRAASALVPEGLERVLVAAVLGAGAAVAQTLLLALVGLGSSPVVLTLAAGATWLAVRAVLPDPAVRLLDELARAIAAAPTGMRLAVGAAAGVLLALVYFFLRHPAVGIDGTAYVLPEIVNWIHSGRPGAEVQASEDFQAGAYPLTHEILLAWSMGLSRSFVPIALATPALLALLAAAGWVGLRRVGVAAAVAAITILAVVVGPSIVGALNYPKNDLAALTWLVVAAALCVAAVRRPPLLAVAILASGLSVGTKTTTAPLVVIVLGVALYLSRRRGIPPLPARGLLLAAVAGAVAVGGVWYVRNLIVHGSPLWPLLTTPWSDPAPPALARIDTSFLDRPIASLEGRTATYVDGLAGGLVLLAAGMLAWVLARSRAVVVASVATAVALLAWMSAPYTGVATDTFVDLSLFVIRYLMPAVCAGAVALALASRGRGPGGMVAIGLLVLAAVWSGLGSLDIRYPLMPSPRLLGAGAFAGAGLAVVARFAVGAPRVLRASAAVAPVAAAVALALAAPGYVERHARTNATTATPVIAWFAAQEEFRDGDAPISLSPQVIGPLAGDRLQHDVQLIPGLAPCREVRARAREGYVVVRDLPAVVRRYLEPYRAGECLAGERAIFSDADFRVYRLPAASP
ncbi:MAG: hypothetical protein MSC31_01635 [Solirubrobacteraceae bacterium MAG38_C4-C5]|nr:hypothetical protein [Candidatus Siliceabacter maunaloa]